jgi:hypothetical protein
MALSLDRLTELFKGVDKDLVVNWHAIAAAAAEIVRLPSNGRRLDDVFLAWYKAPDGSPVVSWNYDRQQYPNAQWRYPKKGDSRITVGEAARSGFCHPGMKEDRVKEWEEWAKAHGSKEVELLLPAYDVKSGYLLLDGAHRSIAILHTKSDYAVELAVIHGPIDEYVLKALAAFS